MTNDDRLLVIQSFECNQRETNVFVQLKVKCSSCVCMFRREGEGLRIFWDRLREPSFSSRWNPFTTDLPYITFTYHPVRDITDTFTSICDVCQSISRKKNITVLNISNHKSDSLFLRSGVMDSESFAYCLGLCWNIRPPQPLCTQKKVYYIFQFSLQLNNCLFTH